jgi:hypothetical protein
MIKCECGSYAINIEDQKQGSHCDVCHWRLKYEQLLKVLDDIVLIVKKHRDLTK